MDSSSLELDRRDDLPASSAGPALLAVAHSVRLVVGSGVALGVASLFANQHMLTSTLGQMATPWVLVAAAVGAFERAGQHRAVVGGALTLAAATIAYNVTGMAISGSTNNYYFLLWLVVGLVVGSMAGYTGWQVKHGPLRLRVIAAAGLAAVCLAEAVVLWGHIDHLDAHLTYTVLGLVGLSVPTVTMSALGARVVVMTTALSLVFSALFVVIFEYAFSALGIV